MHGVRGHRSGRDPADVRMVGAVRREADQFAPNEHGPDERHVREVRPASIGIVQDDLVALPQRAGEIPEDRVHGGGH